MRLDQKEIQVKPVHKAPKGTLGKKETKVIPEQLVLKDLREFRGTGPQGEVGPQGEKGTTGETGPEVKSVHREYRVKRGLLDLKVRSAHKASRENWCNRPQGETVDTGGTGATGATGEVGPQGIQGESAHKA